MTPPAFVETFVATLKGQYRKIILAELPRIIDLLRLDAPLPVRLQDHPLGGDLTIIATSIFVPTCF